MNERFDLVIGLGISGQSCLRYLLAQREPVRALDTRAQPPGITETAQAFSDVPMHLGGWNEAWLNAARRLIVSPGIAIATPEIARQIAAGKEVIGDIELFARAAAQPIAAITGSNAKSTVTTLLAEVAAACGKQALAGGNLGTPALDLLGQNAELYVLELSSFQLETTWSLGAQVACVLNLSEDHLDRYASMMDYVAAKQRIYDGCEVAVWNADDEQTRPQRPVAKSLSFGMSATADFRLDCARGMLMAHGQDLVPVSSLTMRGNHNALNVLAVLAMAEALSLDMQRALSAAQAFAGLPHRCNLVLESRQVQWFNDSKGTNVGATLAALEGIGPSISGRIILIAGGQGKGQDFSALAQPAQRYLRAAILIGEDAQKVAAGLVGVDCHHAADMQDAVRRASLLAEAGDAVLLSPACASFDMFKGYADRGDAFVRAVREVSHAA